MLRNNKKLIKKAYEQLVPYVPGRDADLLAKDLGLKKVIKLASNENSFGPSPKAIEAATQALLNTHRYPDSNATFLRQKLSEKYAVNQENIIIGSGADSLIHSIAQTFLTKADEAIISEYAFATYEIASRANEANPVIVPAKNYAHDLKAMLEHITAKTKLIFLANPNNPTGTYFDLTQFESFLKNIPESVLVVLDEAYYEFIETKTNSLELLNTYANLIVLRTFSKAYGLAGLRVGYGLADASVIELLNRIRSPFTITTASLAAATAALADEAFLAMTLQHCKDMRVYLSKELSSMKLNYMGDVGNFFTVEFGAKTQMIFKTLLNKGIILRPLKNYNMSDYLRISFGLPEDLELLIKELKQVL